MAIRNSAAKPGRASMGNAKGERKMKSKPKQKIAQLSTSGNGFSDKFAEATPSLHSSANISKEVVNNGVNKKTDGEEVKEPFDIMEQLGEHQDLSNFLSNLNEDEELGDNDLMGLEIPMDDLSELNMVYVGGWPFAPSKLPPGNPAIIDCTCEFPRLKEFEGYPYLCVPTWDTRAPQPGEIESAVKWACRKRAQNRPVFVHCAYGHGRSVAVMCALLVALGIVEDWKQAEKFIRERRPYIRMNALHRTALEEWSLNRLSTPKRNEETNVTSTMLSRTSGRSRSDKFTI
ncbi:hypothetical protein LWI28_011887 [Acer negundo]|uniref:Tyrosine specific protein phosphatases domain-containing protein n=1 Tax=Acer negundo TaxID=4023 RepID=A0AAD5NH51_ACENE|nr:hypothetical protein LWI28_011887 [Acer negundo]